MSTRRTQEERSAATARATVKAARQLFGKRGYAAVSMADVVARADRSKGAIYHQFADKQDLLRAVVDQIEGEIADEIRERIEGLDDPLDALLAGCRVFLDRCLDPIALKIVILDAPAVLGWKELRAIDTRHGLGIMIALLDRGMAAGIIHRQPSAPLAHLFLSAAIEAAMLIADAADPAAERDRVALPLLAWLASLRVPTNRPRRSKRTRA